MTRRFQFGLVLPLWLVGWAGFRQCVCAEVKRGRAAGGKARKTATSARASAPAAAELDPSRRECK